MFDRSSLALVALGICSATSIAQADVFNMGGTRDPVTGTWTGQASLEFVTVGDPGNAADTVVMNDGTFNYGAVPYEYRMGTFDVTIGQYVQFLNAVAKNDTYRLYNSYMDMGAGYRVGIGQNGGSRGYTYLVEGASAQSGNYPMFDVTWGDAARFCNWLQNGQPTGAQGPGTTETGAYTLNGDLNPLTETRNAGATYFIPSENEWYKAAYYKGGSANAGYWTYPTQSNTAPSNVLDPTGTNNANYVIYYNGAYHYTDPSNYLTPVGAFAASPGAYGTFDMGGDVSQWNQGVPVSTHRGMRGGSFRNSANVLASSFRDGDVPYQAADDVGFRVASAALPDANGDGTVDIADLSILLTNYDKTGMGWSQGDFNSDGTVDIADLSILLANFDKSYGASAGVKAVPEPGTLALCAGTLASLLAVFAWRQRRAG